MSRSRFSCWPPFGGFRHNEWPFLPPPQVKGSISGEQTSSYYNSSLKRIAQEVSPSQGNGVFSVGPGPGQELLTRMHRLGRARSLLLPGQLSGSRASTPRRAPWNPPPEWEKARSTGKGTSGLWGLQRLSHAHLWPPCSHNPPLFPTICHHPFCVSCGRFGD